jgi:hypothetical protein
MPDMFSVRRASQQRRLGYLIGSAMLIAGIAASGTAQAVVRAPQGAAPHVVAPHVVAPHVVAPHVVAPHVVAPQAVAPQAMVRGPQAASHLRPSPSCVIKTGKTSATPPSGGSIATGTEFTVHCPFPTLDRASRVDSYRGWLLLPPGRWVACNAWITYPPSSPTNNILCGDVTVGTQMTVVAKHGIANITVGV